MKKGFTLVEIIAILIILAVISTIALPAVISAIEDSRQRAYDSQVNIIIESAKKWGVENTELLPTGDSTYKLYLSKLVNEQYVANAENGKIRNPKNSKSYMEGCIYISFNETYNQYIYEYKDGC